MSKRLVDLIRACARITSPISPTRSIANRHGDRTGASRIVTPPTRTWITNRHAPSAVDSNELTPRRRRRHGCPPHGQCRPLLCDTPPAGISTSPIGRSRHLAISPSHHHTITPSHRHGRHPTGDPHSSASRIVTLHARTSITNRPAPTVKAHETPHQHTRRFETRSLSATETNRETRRIVRTDTCSPLACRQSIASLANTVRSATS